MLYWQELHSLAQKKISKVFMDSKISHYEFTLVINEEQNYFRSEQKIISWVILNWTD